MLQAGIGIGRRIEQKRGRGHSPERSRVVRYREPGADGTVENRNSSVTWRPAQARGPFARVTREMDFPYRRAQNAPFATPTDRRSLEKSMGLAMSVPQLLIILVIVALIFGTKRIKEVGGDLGSALKSFRKAMNTSDSDEVHEDPKQLTSDEKPKP
jgi:sec-independent protein translocase protein TatA